MLKLPNEIQLPAQRLEHHTHSVLRAEHKPRISDAATGFRAHATLALELRRWTAEMTERLSLEGLRYAQAVSETGSFSAAARAYGVTQPALSNGIAKLEEHLGVRLFTRSPRGVSPTTFGVKLLPLIHDVVRGLDTVLAEAQRSTAPTNENMRIGVSPLISPQLVARTYGVVNSLPSDAQARRQLVLREANMEELREGLVAGALDMIIVPSVVPMPRYEHRVISSEPLVLIANDGPSSKPAYLHDLADQPLILMPDTCGLTTFVRNLLADHALPLRAYPGEASSYQVLEAWSNLGLGSAMLPKSKLTESSTQYREVCDDEGHPIEIFYEALWDPSSTLAPEIVKITDRLHHPDRELTF